MTFSDATHGWVLGPECDDNHKCGSAIRATTDGGVTWQRLALPTPNPQLSKSEATHHAATHIRFLDDKNGWLYGPGLFSTTDSGKTWTDETLANDIVLMGAKQDTVWAIENQCAATNPYDCNLRLLNLDSSNHTWKYLPSEPALKQAYAFAHPTPKDAWIASPDLLGNKPGTLIVTHNAGKTWRTLPLPCTTLNLDHLAALGDGELWYFCASEASAGQQSKEIYYSSDDGSTWRRIADSSRDGLGNLSIGGYLEYFTTSEPHHIWALYQREFVYESKDAGTTWTYVPAYIGFNDSPKGPILFIDPSHGWIGSYNGINRTTDGGATWKIYVIDPGQYPSLGG